MVCSANIANACKRILVPNCNFLKSPRKDSRSLEMIVLADSKISNRGMVEQNVPPQLKAVGERMVGVVTRWWEKARRENAYGLPSGYD